MTNQPPNFCSSECAGRVSVTILSSRRRIAERFRWAALINVHSRQTNHMKTNKATSLGILVLILRMNQAFSTDVTINRSGSQVILSWPLADTNEFYLQTTTNLSAPIAWLNAADPATNGNSLVVTNQIAGTNSFYRLQAWEVLFDGTNTTALRSPTANSFPSNSWVVTNGTLMSKVVANATNFMTVSTYTNFELRLNWKCDPYGNSGIFYRRPPGVASDIPEYQLFDDANVATAGYTDSTYQNPVNLMGAVYGIIAPTNKTLVPAGQWNDCRVVVQGYHVTHWLNGKVIVDYQINDPVHTNSMSQATNTYIAFQNKGTGDHGRAPGVVYYRDIKIRRLP